MSTGDKHYIPDGGPAFPYGQENFTIRSSTGMTIRDYFASAALTGILSNVDIDMSKAFVNPQKATDQAYNFADAMLVSRKKLPAPKEKTK